jgi:lysylphosphatidylglycerol synthetase-like protein (DUF2156 family)
MLFSPDGTVDSPLQAVAFICLCALGLAIAIRSLMRGAQRLGPAGLVGQFATADLLLIAALALLVPLNLIHHAHMPITGVFRPDVGDGGLVENLTVTLMLFPVILVASRLGSRQRSMAFGPLSLVLMCILLVLAFGEEVSWGQHWFGFTPPEAVARTNLQEEFNLHNYITPSTMELAYFLAGVVLMIGAARLGSLVEASDGDTVLLPLRALLVLTAALMGHHIFQELAELALMATAFLVWKRLDDGRLRFRSRPLRMLAAR